MRFNLQYGAGSLPLEINGRLNVDVIKPRTIVDIPNSNIIMNCLESPENSQSLSKLTTNIKSVAIAVTDPDDSRISTYLLDSLLEFLSSQIPDSDNISIIYPNYFNYPDNSSEWIKLLNKANKQGCVVIPHDPNSFEHLQFVGVTPTYSTPVHVNKAFVQAELRIGIGTIRSNVFVGATGGRMSVIPGCAGNKSIERNLKLQAIHPIEPYSIESASCLDLEEASRLAGLDFILNAVPDCEGHIAHIASGNPYTSWQSSIKAVHEVSKTQMQCRADITVVSAGGLNHDKTLYDALDVLYPAYEATEQGGVIILVAECPGGVGPIGFLKGVSECTTESEVEILSQTGYEIGMEKARFLWWILSSRKVILCSRLRESLVTERLHCLAVRDPQEGIDLARRQIVTQPRIAIIPQGMITVPVLKS